VAVGKMNELSQLVGEAGELAARLSADIPLAKTREEHIRVTARANEAANLFQGLSELAAMETASLIG
jgi:hypothetical protein